MLVFVLCAASIWVAGIFLSNYTDVLSDRLQLSAALYPAAPPRRTTSSGTPPVVVNLCAYAPNGTMQVGSYAAFTGAALGKRVNVASNAVLNEDSAFLAP